MHYFAAPIDCARPALRRDYDCTHSFAKTANEVGHPQDGFELYFGGSLSVPGIVWGTRQVVHAVDTMQSLRHPLSVCIEVGFCL